MEFLHHVVQSARNSVEEFIYRDEFMMKKNGGNLKVKKKKVVQFESQPLIRKIEKLDGSGGGIQLKILMRREEAARLLSKCKDRDGEALQFKDVANELVCLPNNRIQVVCSSTTKND